MAMRSVNANVAFNEGSVTIDKERYTEWKAAWKKLKKILSEGQKRNKQQSLNEEDYGWLKCNTDPRKHHQSLLYRSK